MLKLLTIAEVAGVLRVTPQWAYYLARSGNLPCVRIGRRIRVLEADLTAWLQGRRT